MTDGPTITIVLRPTREVEIALALRALLNALRRHGLRAVKIEESALQRDHIGELYKGDDGAWIKSKVSRCPKCGELLEMDYHDGASITNA